MRGRKQEPDVNKTFKARFTKALHESGMEEG